MQTTLEKAIAKLQTLPPDKQESIAAVILEELEKTQKPSKEQIAVLEAQELEGYKRYPPQKDKVDDWQDEQVWES
jgi:hypothetical protein